MKNKKMTLAFSMLLILFYIAIVLFAFFPVLHIDMLENFLSALLFEIIGFALLTYFILGFISTQSKKIGFLVPLIISTLLYTLVLDFLNLVLVSILPSVVFVLFNLVLLFIYCLTSVPMYIMGNRSSKEEL